MFFPKITSLMMICSLIDCHITLKTGMGLVVKVSYKVNVIRINYSYSAYTVLGSEGLWKMSSIQSA